MHTNLQSFFNYFDNAYVLTFERATNRQVSIRKKLEGCKYEFFNGFDSKTLNLDELERKGVYEYESRKAYYPYPAHISIGQLACSWGHQQMYKKIVEAKYEHTLILEDDIVVDDTALASLPDAIESIPSDADLIYWGYEVIAWPQYNTLVNTLINYVKLFGVKLRGRKGLFIHSFPVTTFSAITDIYYKPYNLYFHKAGAHYGTHAFSVTKKGAETLLRLQTPVSLEADHLLINAVLSKHLKAYIAARPVFVQDKLTEQPNLENFILEH